MSLLKNRATIALTILAAFVLAGGCPMNSGDMGTPPANGQSSNTTFIRSGDDAIYTDGNVGIGTETPAERLDVDGNANISGNATIGGNANVTGTVFADAFSSNSPLHLQTAGETRIFVDDANGNVGIGTETPGRRLEVAGDALFNTFVLLDSAGVQTPEFTGRRSLGSSAAPTAVTDGSVLTRLSARGNNGSAFPAGGRIDFVASQSWSGSANGGRIAFYTTPDNATSSVERIRIEQNGRVGIGTSTPSEALHVVGNICATGTIAACSDARFKTNVKALDQVLDEIDRLRPVAYDWKKDEFPDHGFDERRQIGLIAQELRKVVPEAVLEGNDGYLSIDYSRLTPVLIQALRELRAEKSGEIERLRKEKDAQIAELEFRLARLEAAMTSRPQESAKRTNRK